MGRIGADACIHVCIFIGMYTDDTKCIDYTEIHLAVEDERPECRSILVIMMHDANQPPFFPYSV